MTVIATDASEVVEILQLQKPATVPGCTRTTVPLLNLIGVATSKLVSK